MKGHYIAPGKIVVLGEYAVVDGGAAIVAAVPSGVACRVYDAPSLEIEVPGGDDRFVRAALVAVDAPTARYCFADHLPPATPSKAGLGGSAAATVVAAWAGLASRGTPDRALVHAVASRVHRQVQGSGSGVDVAASAFGGLLRFARAEPPAPLAPLPLVAMWSGTSAATGPRLRQYEAWHGRRVFLDTMATLVEELMIDPVSTMREGRRLLEGMAEEAGIDYRTPGLDRLCDLAEELGGGAKPSGAGGGDCAVAVFPDEDRAQTWIALASAKGFVPVSSTIAPGVGPA